MIASVQLVNIYKQAQLLNRASRTTFAPHFCTAGARTSVLHNPAQEPCTKVQRIGKMGKHWQGSQIGNIWPKSGGGEELHFASRSCTVQPAKSPQQYKKICCCCCCRIRIMHAQGNVQGAYREVTTVICSVLRCSLVIFFVVKELT